MQFHEISCVGRLWIHRVPILPTWTVNDVGRLLFVISKNAIFYGGTTAYADWIDVTEHFLDTGTGTDPIDSSSFTNREYIQKINNGNIRLYY